MNTAKLPKKQVDLSQIRVTRKSNTELHHGENHGWAVSYADMLMVLLSFFVLFFSLEEGGGDMAVQLERLAMSMRGEVPAPLTEAQKKRSSMTLTAEQQQTLKNVTVALTGQDLKVNQIESRLIVDLGDTAYPSGAYRMSEDLQGQVDSFFEHVRPMQEEIFVTVIGHTDDVPLRYRNELLQDNFDLSSIRALTVLKYLMKKGYPEHLLGARAANSFDRNSRSISFEIRVRTDEGVPQ